jgi:hypothetical protein
VLNIVLLNRSGILAHNFPATGNPVRGDWLALTGTPDGSQYKQG